MLLGTPFVIMRNQLAASSRHNANLCCFSISSLAYTEQFERFRFSNSLCDCQSHYCFYADYQKKLDVATSLSSFFDGIVFQLSFPLFDCKSPSTYKDTLPGAYLYSWKCVHIDRVSYLTLLASPALILITFTPCENNHQKTTKRIQSDSRLFLCFETLVYQGFQKWQNKRKGAKGYYCAQNQPSSRLPDFSLKPPTRKPEFRVDGWSYSVSKRR